MLGYHTDNVYSTMAHFSIIQTVIYVSELQMPFIIQDFIPSVTLVLNNGSALLSSGDVRELHFRRQELTTNVSKRKWISEASNNTLPFVMEHVSLFAPCT